MLSGYIIFAILLVGFFFITYVNSPKYAWILLGIVALSFGMWYIRAIRMYSLLGIVGVLMVMVMSRTAREKAIQQWFAKNGFLLYNVSNPAAFFNDVIAGNKTYQSFQKNINYQGKIMPITLVLRYNVFSNGRSKSLVVHCCYFFRENADLTRLEARMQELKKNTPHTGLFKSQFNYFDLQACDIFNPDMGGLAIVWRVPHTVKGHSDRWNWIQQALE